MAITLGNRYTSFGSLASPSISATSTYNGTLWRLNVFVVNGTVSGTPRLGGASETLDEMVSVALTANTYLYAYELYVAGALSAAPLSIAFTSTGGTGLYLLELYEYVNCSGTGAKPAPLAEIGIGSTTCLMPTVVTTAANSYVEGIVAGATTAYTAGTGYTLNGTNVYSGAGGVALGSELGNSVIASIGTSVTPTMITTTPYAPYGSMAFELLAGTSTPLGGNTRRWIMIS